MDFSLTILGAVRIKLRGHLTGRANQALQIQTTGNICRVLQSIQKKQCNVWGLQAMFLSFLILQLPRLFEQKSSDHNITSVDFVCKQIQVQLNFDYFLIALISPHSGYLLPGM